MTAKTISDVTVERKDGQIVAFPVLASTKILRGAPVFRKSSGRYVFSNDGTTNTVANGDIFVGIAIEEVTGTTTSGEVLVRCFVEGNILMKFSDTLTAGNGGSLVYVNNVSDDSVVTVTSDTGNPQVTIGHIEQFVSANYAIVRLHTASNRIVAAAGA